MKNLKGYKVSALGWTFTIDKVLFADLDEGEMDIEFIDINGGYHHWKQIFDGGKLIAPKKKYISPKGYDYTDLFNKYGY